MKQTKMDFNKPFDGSDFQPDHDQKRLTGQLQKLYRLMKDGTFRTLSEIERFTGIPQASASAQLRNLRKPRFGAFTVNKRRRGEASSGLYEYQVTT